MTGLEWSDPERRLETNQWRMKNGSRPALLVDAESRRILEANVAASRKYGYRRVELVGLPIETLWPAAPVVWPSTDGAQRTAASEAITISRHQHKSGSPLDFLVQGRGLVRAGRRVVSLVLSEVSERAFSLALMESEGRVLEVLARGGRLDELLADLVLAIERLSSGMRGSVLLLDEDGRHVRHGAAPNLPASYWHAIDGARIGPAAGSCGTAMYSARQVVVADIASDQRWRPYRELALRHGLRACWSTPIFSRKQQVLGAFALYYDQVRSPGKREQRLVQIAADLAAIAVERDIADRRLGVSAAGKPARRSPVAPAHAKLSAREQEVFQLIARGEPVKRIARTLDLSISTLYTHRRRIFEKLGVSSNVALARYALEHDAAH
jgi:DNA-binding NarL/FixJ family response regulator